MIVPYKRGLGGWIHAYTTIFETKGREEAGNTGGSGPRILKGSLFICIHQPDIKEADISRGSFYTYFEDKDDLMRYMLRGFRDNCQERIFRTLKEQGGNPFGTALMLLEAVVEEDHGGLGYKMYRNMLSDLSVVDQNHLFGIKGFLLQDESYGEFVHKLYEGIDRERYPIDEETLSYLVDMAMLIIIRAVTLYYKNVVDREKLLEVTKKEMLILEYGVCRNTGN